METFEIRRTWKGIFQILKDNNGKVNPKQNTQRNIIAEETHDHQVSTAGDNGKNTLN